MMDASKGPAPSDPYAFSDDFEEPGKANSSSKIKNSVDISKNEPAANSAGTSEERTQNDSSKELVDEKLPVAIAASSPVQKISLDGAEPATNESHVTEVVSEGTSKPTEIPAVVSHAKLPVLPALEILRKSDKDSDVGSNSPLGSPLTPDSAENAGTDQSDREASPSSRKRRQKNRRQKSPVTTPTTDASTSKRRPTATDFPGSPQTVVSERRQLALLRQQARDTEKQKSPDTSFTRDGPSTPSSTGSSKEARSANRRDGKGETPLHVACKKGDLVAVKKLLDDGADVNAADNAGWTPLHEAANHGREDVTRLLVKNGANLGARAVDGLTPLMDAVLNDHLSIAKVLLKSGADPNCENDKGESCLDLVEDRQNFKELFLNFNKDLEGTETDPSRKRKRETADAGMVKGRPVSVQNDAILDQVGEKKAPAAAPVTEKVKDKSESQYEDISEDEEAEVVDAPSLLASQPHDAGPSATPSTSQAEIAPLTNPTPTPPISVTSPPSSETGTSKPSLSSVRPVPKLRPPSPVSTTPSVTDTSESAIVSSTATPPVGLKKESVAVESVVSSDLSKNAQISPAVEEKTLPSELSEKIAQSDAALKSVPVHEASAMPPSTSEKILIAEVVPQTTLPETTSTDRPAVSEETIPGTRYTVTDFGIVSVPQDKPDESKVSPSEESITSEAKNLLANPPLLPESETPTEKVTETAIEKDTETPTEKVTETPTEKLPEIPSISTSIEQVTTSDPPLEEAPVHAAPPVLPVTEPPVVTSGLSPLNRPPSATATPSSLTVKLPAISTKMPPALPIASGVSLAVPPPLVFPAVLTAPVTSPTKTSSVTETKKDKKVEKNKENPTKITLAGTSFLPQGPPQERLMLTVKRSIKETLKETADESKDRETAVVVKMEDSVGASTSAALEPATSPSKKQKEEKQAKPMTRAQRAQAQATPQSTGPGRRRKEKDEKQPRGRPSKRAAADADIQSGEDAGGLDTKPKRLSVRLSPKKLKGNKEDSNSPAKLTIQDGPKSPVELSIESSARLPFKKRLTIRNEIEEFINQRRQVEENWKKYTNNFPMKVFPKNCNEYLILRKNYSPDAALPKKLDAPLALPLALKDFFVEQAEERAKLIRSHVIERDRLVMGAEQEMMRLHQRFCRITAGITIPYSACMIISEQDSNRSFQNQEQEERTRNATRNRISMRDLIKWLEESDDKFDYAKKELLTRHRLEAGMLRSKQRLDWAWKASDLNLIDPSCRNPEELPNLYVPEVVVEDFVLLPDNV